MKILYITTIGITMGFFKSLIRELLDAGHCVDIATNENNGNDPIPECYREWGCKVYQILCSRSPLKKCNISAIKEIKKIVKNGNYDIVHCHTPIAAACTRIACRKLRKNGVKVIYTAHGFHFYSGAPLKNWLLYYPVEWVCAHWTDVLITINAEDYERAKKHMHARRVEYVPGVGIDSKRFMDAKVDRSAKRRELGVPEDALLLVSVGELNKNKNHEIIIKAIAKLDNPKIHYAVAGIGDYEDNLQNLAKSLGVGTQLHLLGFRNDVPELYKSADICAFPSIREGLGLAALEGMAAGLPLLCSDNRGTREYAINGENAIVCNTVENYAKGIIILEESEKRKILGDNASASAKRFDKSLINQKMRDIYSR